jgi:hypothetical protein
MTFRNLPALAALAVLAPAYVIACAADPGDAPKGILAATSTVSVPVGSTSSSTSNTVGYGSGTSSSIATGFGTTTTGFTSATGTTSGTLGSTTTTSSTSTTTIPPCTTCKLQLTYQAVQKGAMSGSIGFNIKLFNNDPMGGVQDLSQVKIRYYFTNELSNLVGQVNTASISNPAGPTYYAGLAGVTLTFTMMTTPTSTADTYLEFGFPMASLPAGATAEVDVQFNPSSNQGSFNQANDYSFNGNAASYTPSTTITVYVSGTLVSGTEPS